VFDLRNNSLRELIRTQHEEFREEFRRRDEEMREFNREILLRNEKVYKAVIAEAEEGRKQIQANTRAVLSVLDRLDEAA
jgi:predicted phage gp36 major capsid-like protein